VTPSTRAAALLLDLDGTLLDTAPDMAGALNALLREERRAPLEFATIRPHVSHGSTALVALGFGSPDATEFERLRRRFLDLYAANLVDGTCVMDGFDAVLATLEARGVPWGVVTNKPRHLTEPLLAALGLRDRSACTVSGDTLPERKPHPRPIQFALERLSLAAEPGRAVYVGDARRDIESGRAAGTRTIAVRYGYVEPGQDPATWGADQIADTTFDLITLLREGR
jgi:phosphoglycolate phosphatase